MDLDEVRLVGPRQGHACGAVSLVADDQVEGRQNTPQGSRRRRGGATASVASGSPLLIRCAWAIWWIDWYVENTTRSGAVAADNPCSNRTGVCGRRDR